ncbi:transcriptional regulator [Burkholderia pseudomallei]|uniref:transcriptional regulator n=1 Tax=Burkholderia pseudomallei TaxID=28450 RepID=UPI001604A8C8|nr:transcriptional regulator [Burkholderia pseudomallei]
MHEQKAPRSSERGVFCWAAAGSIPAGAQPVRRRDAAKVDPRASRGHAIERRANVVREKAGKPRTQPQKEPQKEPQKCRKSAAKVPQNERPGEGRGAPRFFSLRVSRRGGAAVRFAPRTAACPAPRGLPRHRDSMRGWRLNAGSTFDIDGAP